MTFLRTAIMCSEDEILLWNQNKANIYDEYNKSVSEELKNLKNMVSQIEVLKNKLPILNKDSKSKEKALENYSKEDLEKLNDILKSVEKK